MIAYQAGEAVNIMITLRDLDTALYVWTQNFELKLENWFVVQRQVVQRIAMGLNVYLSAERLRRFSDQPRSHWVSTTAGCAAKCSVRTFDPRYWNTLMQQYTDITVEAPDFGPAYTGLADMHNSEHIFHPGVFRTPRVSGRHWPMRAKLFSWIRLMPVPTGACLVPSHGETIRSGRDAYGSCI